MGIASSLTENPGYCLPLFPYLMDISVLSTYLSKLSNILTHSLSFRNPTAQVHRRHAVSHPVSPLNFTSGRRRTYSTSGRKSDILFHHKHSLRLPFTARPAPGKPRGLAFAHYIMPTNMPATRVDTMDTATMPDMIILGIRIPFKYSLSSSVSPTAFTASSQMM